MTKSKKARLLSLPILALLIAACSDQPVNPKENVLQLAPAKIEILSGQDQVALAGEELPTTLELRVLDINDRPLAGQLVRYEVVSGAGAVSIDSAYTDQEGIARGEWKLGPEPGANMLRATVANTSSRWTSFREIIEAFFRARGVRPAPRDVAAGVEIVGGQGQSAVAGTTLPEVLVVRVVDSRGNPVAGQEVEYRVTGGGGRLQVNGRVSDEDGLARARWTLGTEPGRNTAEARVLESGTNRVIATARFTAEGTAAPKEPEQPEPEDPKDPEPPVALDGECARPQAGWIWCDDFEENRLNRYFEYNNGGGSFTRASGVGVDGSHGMRVRFNRGQVDAGSLKLAIGATPSSYFRPVDDGRTKYREIYWRMYVKNAPNWVGGGGGKLSRATSIVSSSWSQSMIAHVWSGGPNHNFLVLDPASGTDAQGNVRTSGYNDFSNLRWLGIQQGRTPIFERARINQWYCVEAHVRLNDAGRSNGVFEYWIDDQLEARTTNLNWVGAYDAYGINAVFFENYWDAGAPQVQERYFDNIVVSTQRIGCGTPVGGGGNEPPPSEETTISTVTVTPETSRLTALGDTLRLQLTARDQNGQRISNAPVSWTSTNPSVATVNSRGVVTARAEGRAQIIARATCCSSVVDTVTVDVEQVVASVAVSAPSSRLEPRANMQLTATARDSRGNPVANANFTWRSSNTAVATVNSSGRVTGVAEGTVEITATAGGRSGSTTIQVRSTTAPRPPTQGYPNEPAGYTQITQRNFAAKVENGWRLSEHSPGRLDIVADPTVPTGLPTVARAFYPAGWSAGHNPINAYYEPGSLGVTDIYLSYYVKLSDNWQGHPSGVNKIMYVWINNKPVVYTSAQGSGTGALIPQIRLQDVPDGGRNLQPNVRPTKQIERGKWHRWEIQMTPNTNGQRNGTIRWWIDGELVGEYHDVILVPQSASRVWNSLQWAPVWGGMGSSLSRDQYMWMSEIYVSGRR